MSHLARVPGLARLEITPRGLRVLEFRSEQVTGNDEGVGEQARRTMGTRTQRAGGAAPPRVQLGTGPCGPGESALVLAARLASCKSGLVAAARRDRSGLQGSLLFCVGLGVL